VPLEFVGLPETSEFQQPSARARSSALRTTTIKVMA
jgi:hypothetical protein